MCRQSKYKQEAAFRSKQWGTRTFAFLCSQNYYRREKHMYPSFLFCDILSWKDVLFFVFSIRADTLCTFDRPFCIMECMETVQHSYDDDRKFSLTQENVLRTLRTVILYIFLTVTSRVHKVSAFFERGSWCDVNDKRNFPAPNASSLGRLAPDQTRFLLFLIALVCWKPGCKNELPQKDMCSKSSPCVVVAPVGMYIAIITVY